MDKAEGKQQREERLQRTRDTVKTECSYGSEVESQRETVKGQCERDESRRQQGDDGDGAEQQP